MTAAKLAGEDAREARRERRVGWKAPALKGTVRTAQPKSGGCEGGLGLPAVRQRLRLWRQRSALARKRTGEEARETKLAELRALTVPELKQLCDQQEGGAGSAAGRRAEQRRTTCGEKEFLEGRGAKDVGPPGDAEPAAPEEASLGWSCSAAQRRRSVQGHGEAGAYTQVEYVDCVRAERYGGAQHWKCGGIGT